MKSLAIILSVAAIVGCSKGTEGGVPPPESATLIYDITGATAGEAPASVTALPGTEITLDNGTGFERTGYTFTGWSASSGASNGAYPPGGNYPLNNNTRLYAAWENTTPNTQTMKITIADQVFTATLADTPAAREFKAMLPLTLNMSDYNRNEKVAGLPKSLTTTTSTPRTIQTGDLMLYGSSSLVVFYQTFPNIYNYTRIGTITNPSGLAAAVGSGSITIQFE